jgi:4a-hydroxytetrahydrobiopterin dehydratase
MELSRKRCIPCEGNVPPLSREEVEKYLSQVEGWTLVKDGTVIQKILTFKDFDATMEFVNKVAAVAEEEGHHPDLDVSYGKLGIELTTHAIGGLSENDFILASKIDRISQ